jgi:hypothetical protein
LSQGFHREHNNDKLQHNQLRGLNGTA